MTRSQMSNFNPRSREGSDRLCLAALSCILDFNPRSREGSDCEIPPMFPYCWKFQSTLPWRERLECHVFSIVHTNFNPRSREGSDWLVKIEFVNLNYFNPRSREGSDFFTSSLKSSSEISIHAPVKGATTASFVLFSRLSDFNPRSREGSDFRRPQRYAGHPYFNSSTTVLPAL